MGRKRIEEKEFLDKVRNQNYDFKNTKFINMKTPIEVNCLIHGVFKILPTNMLYKSEGCKFCGIEKMSKTKSLTKQEFIKKSNHIHHNKYDYSLVDYKNNKTKIKIICKQCGNIFEQFLSKIKGLLTIACKQTAKVIYASRYFVLTDCIFWFNY